jgi:peptidyl-prolyl cis-trans isomerase B (cyclophilin B)
MQTASLLMVLFSVLIPSKMWYAPGQPIMVTARADGQVTLMLAEFSQPARARASVTVTGGQELDLKKLFLELNSPGTHILYAVPEGGSLDQMLGTPLVIQGRTDRRPGMNHELLVYRVEPLRYAILTTSKGPITAAFYYDVAPNTSETFLRLSHEGFYDGLAFHRIVPGFVIQGGDPLGTGTGGPGYRIQAEFSDRKHLPGVFSMARTGDPHEPQMKPRSEFANSAGSQFFICLEHKEHLDNRYTAFGRVVQGMDVVQEIARTPLADPGAGRPKEAPVILSVQVLPVTAQNNPYLKLFDQK